MTSFNKIFLTTAATLFLFAACQEDVPEREISPAMPDNCQGIYFPETNPTVIELEPSDPTQFTVTIARVDSVNAAEVPITVDINTDNVFVVPANAVFAAGEKTATITVTFPTADEGVTYNLKLSVSGDEYVNQYASTVPYVSINVTRVKWTEIDDKIIMVNSFWGDVHYIPKAEIVSFATGVSNIRLTNPFLPAKSDEPDENGIYDGAPAVWPDEVVNDKIQLIVTVYDDDTVVIQRGGIGCMWYDIEMEIVTVEYGKAFRDNNGNIVRIDFPPQSLFIIANSSDQGWYNSDGTFQIYFSFESYLTDNRKIEDFNEVEYEEIEGAVGEFESAAYSESWNQTIAKATDIDPENEDSEYKDLYYLPNLYTDNYGLAFYYNGRVVSIPAEQKTGIQIFGKDLYVSKSDNIESSVTTSSKGVDIYTLGLIFHLEDGTIVGEFAETFYYSKEPIAYKVTDFYGKFLMTGKSAFEEPDAEMSVYITAGDDPNTFVIKGIDYAETVRATFDPQTSFMLISPQDLPDYKQYAMSLYTMTPDGDYSVTASLAFAFNMKGQLTLTPNSEAIGYLLYSETLENWVDGYYNLVLTPQVETETTSATTAVANPTKKILNTNSVAKAQKASNGNFAVQGKLSTKTLSKRNLKTLF